MVWSTTQALRLFATVLIALSRSAAARAQWVAPPTLQAPASVQGTLTVTATVVSSVGMIIGPDGRPTVIVANAPSPGDILSASAHGSQRGLVARDELVLEASGVSRVTLKRSGCSLGQDRR